VLNELNCAVLIQVINVYWDSVFLCLLWHEYDMTFACLRSAAQLELNGSDGCDIRMGYFECVVMLCAFFAGMYVDLAFQAC